MTTIPSTTIVFITGAFVHHSCWDNWREFFNSHGYHTVAPPWPEKNADAATLRSRHPDPALAGVTMEELVTYYTGIIEGLPEKPILIGHSFGGLLAQVLLNQGKAAAAVAVHAVPPQGVVPYEWDFIKSNTKALGFFTSLEETYMISFEKWQYTFTNGMSQEEQQIAYDQYAIPESKRALRGGLTSTAFVDFKKDHLPLLILAGSNDQCIPAHLCERVFNKYKKEGSVTDYKLKDRNHFVLGQATWKTDAEDILHWLNKEF